MSDRTLTFEKMTAYLNSLGADLSHLEGVRIASGLPYMTDEGLEAYTAVLAAVASAHDPRMASEQITAEVEAVSLEQRKRHHYGPGVLCPMCLGGKLNDGGYCPRCGGSGTVPASSASPPQVAPTGDGDASSGSTSDGGATAKVAHGDPADHVHDPEDERGTTQAGRITACPECGGRLQATRKVYYDLGGVDMNTGHLHEPIPSSSNTAFQREPGSDEPSEEASNDALVGDWDVYCENDHKLMDSVADPHATYDDPRHSHVARDINDEPTMKGYDEDNSPSHLRHEDEEDEDPGNLIPPAMRQEAKLRDYEPEPLHSLAAREGFSFTAAEGMEPQKYLVPMPGHELRFDRKRITPHAIGAFTTQRSEALGQPNTFMTAWHDGNEGIWLDVAQTARDHNQALRLARTYGQAAIYDVSAGKAEQVGDLTTIPPEKPKESKTADDEGANSEEDTGALIRRLLEQEKTNPHRIVSETGRSERPAHFECACGKTFDAQTWGRASASWSKHRGKMDDAAKEAGRTYFEPRCQVCSLPVTKAANEGWKHVDPKDTHEVAIASSHKPVGPDEKTSAAGYSHCSECGQDAVDDQTGVCANCGARGEDIQQPMSMHGAQMCCEGGMTAAQHRAISHDGHCCTDKTSKTTKAELRCTILPTDPHLAHSGLAEFLGMDIGPLAIGKKDRQWTPMDISNETHDRTEDDDITEDRRMTDV